ncbi:MAG: hypothetical protein ABI205_05800 [Gemmatimonadaceae bacterium]
MTCVQSLSLFIVRSCHPDKLCLAVVRVLHIQKLIPLGCLSPGVVVSAQIRMFSIASFALFALALTGSGVAAQQPTDSLPTASIVAQADTPQVRKRPRAIEYSDAYNTRLTIHRIGSYTMLPLFAGEWYLGDRLLNGVNPPGWMKPAHAGVAGALGVLFTVNTITGAWNLWDSRDEPAGRTRRYLHTGLMLASDAGFAWAGAIGGSAKHNYSTARQHRNIALGSIALSTAGTALMWFWKD